MVDFAESDSNLPGVWFILYRHILHLFFYPRNFHVMSTYFDAETKDSFFNQIVMTHPGLLIEIEAGFAINFVNGCLPFLGFSPTNCVFSFFGEMDFIFSKHCTVLLCSCSGYVFLK